MTAARSATMAMAVSVLRRLIRLGASVLFMIAVVSTVSAAIIVCMIVPLFIVFLILGVLLAVIPCMAAIVFPVGVFELLVLFLLAPFWVSLHIFFCDC
jgi:hypothetical protein